MTMSVLMSDFQTTSQKGFYILTFVYYTHPKLKTQGKQPQDGQKTNPATDVTLDLRLGEKEKRV